MTYKSVELLSPVGSFACLQAAINGGSDAIYFGVEQLNMRTRSAGTFTNDDIPEIAQICKAAGIKAYITLNTVMYEHDMQLLKAILQQVKNSGIDAVIAADFAAISYCNEMNIPLHISTQANVSNIEAVQFFARFADVVVLARELTLKQIEQICKEIKRRDVRGVSGDLLKIEVFVHGALCMAVSGKCYLSLHSQNASANRGACVQNCRRPYRVIDTETEEELLIDNEYIMSPKDLCTIDFLDELLATGIDVLKIEGRSKGADYVQVVTQCYREAIKSVHDQTFSPDKVAAWLETLRTVYNRDFWGGYYLGRELGEWTKNPGSAATDKKIYVGKGAKYYPKIQIGEFLIEAGSIKVGDTIMITGPHIGMTKETMETLVVNGTNAAIAQKGDRITLPIAQKVTREDKIYKIIPA